jgi:uncharacterized membrane protein (UPF0127 family)
MRRLAIAIAAAALASGCGASADAGIELPRSPAAIDTGVSIVRLTVEIARTEEDRQKGLMSRRSLAPRRGMLFVFPGATRGGFWMKNTLIPLSIAFMDGRGRILRILDMTPCRADPCRIYEPNVTYRRALEVNRGAFRRWGVGVGDRFRLTR